MGSQPRSAPRVFDRLQQRQTESIRKVSEDVKDTLKDLRGRWNQFQSRARTSVVENYVDGVERDIHVHLRVGVGSITRYWCAVYERDELFECSGRQVYVAAW